MHISGHVGEWAGSDQAAGKVDTCCSRGRAVEPLRLGEAKESVTGHGDVLVQEASAIVTAVPLLRWRISIVQDDTRPGVLLLT